MVADVGLVLFGNSSMRVEHTQSHASSSNDDDVFVCRQAAGSLTLEQDGRAVILEPGDVTLLDPQLPYAGRFTTGSRPLVLKVPRHALTARMGCVRRVVLHSIRPTAGEGGVASGFLEMLPTYASEIAPAAAEMVKSNALDLAALALANSVDAVRGAVSSAQMLVLMHVRAAIEARLADPSLNASRIAAAAGVSVRYANLVLAKEGTSIRRLVLARRLTRCRKALADGSQAVRTVTKIAYTWGFSDMTHFGRSFKAAYGVTPSDFRHNGRGCGR